MITFTYEIVFATSCNNKKKPEELSVLLKLPLPPDQLFQLRALIGN